MNRMLKLLAALLVLIALIGTCTTAAGAQTANTMAVVQPTPPPVAVPVLQPITIRATMPNGLPQASKVNPFAFAQIQRYDEWGYLRYVAATYCRWDSQDEVLCFDFNGFTKIGLTNGRYLLMVNGSERKTVWKEFTVPVPGGFLDATLETADIERVEITTRIDRTPSGRVFSGYADVLKTTLEKYEGRIELQISSPGLGIGFAFFTQQVWEEEIDLFRTRVNFNVPMPDGLPRGHYVCAVLPVMSEQNRFDTAARASSCALID